MNIKHIHPTAWQQVIESAETDIRKSHPQPTFASFKAGRAAEFPWRVTVPVLVLLVIVWIAAMYISTTKMIEATHLAFPDLDATGAPASIFTFSETGLILFGLAAVIFSNNVTASRLFRVTSWLCAVTALLSNISVTVLEIQQAVPAFQVYVTLLVPFLAIAIGLFLENMVANSLVSHHQAKVAYEEAYGTWSVVNADPQADPKWLNALGPRVLQALQNAQGRPDSKERQQFRAMIEQDAALSVQLVHAELAWKNIDFTSPPELNPINPGSEPGSLTTTGETLIQPVNSSPTS